MSRPTIKDEILTAVLVSSRRRCCLCFGLNRDLAPKAGQIAHLNQKRNDNREDNLVFLCLQHHDAYDSRTSQSKGLTVGEVRAYRNELYTRLGDYLKLPVRFGDVALPADDPVAGEWVRRGGGHTTADLTLTPLQDSMEGNPRYALTGLALFGIERPGGPNLGDLSFIADLSNGVIEHAAAAWDGELHVIRITFKDGLLLFDEENEIGQYGMGVTFRGTYERVR